MEDKNIIKENDMKKKEDINNSDLENFKKNTIGVTIVVDKDSLHIKGKDVTKENWEEAYECRKTILKYLAQDGDCVGVAAQQVGYNLNMFLMRYDDKILTVINPSITLLKPTKYMINSIESCLSLPGHSYTVRRCSAIKTRYRDENMNIVEKRFKGAPAIAFQHEKDHNDGILICDVGRQIR